MADTSNMQTQGSSRFGRYVIYALLGLVCIYYLMPLFIMVSTSLKTLDDIRTGNLIELPKQITFGAWLEAWGSACIGVRCDGMSVYFWNSFRFVVPAVLISTFVGAFNGYVLTMWRFKGSDLFLSALLIGCFIPFQVILLPMARTLGMMGIQNSIAGLIFRPRGLWNSLHNAFLPQLFRDSAARIDQGRAKYRRSWILDDLRPHHPATIDSHRCRTIIWQFTSIWNDFLFGVVFSTGDRTAGDGRAEQSGRARCRGAVRTMSIWRRRLLAALPTLCYLYRSGG